MRERRINNTIIQNSALVSFHHTLLNNAILFQGNLFNWDSFFTFSRQLLTHLAGSDNFAETQGKAVL